MAITLQAAAPVTMGKQERTWRTEIETPKGQPYSLIAHREVVVTDANGAKLYNDEALAKSYSWRSTTLAQSMLPLTAQP